MTNPTAALRDLLSVCEAVDPGKRTARHESLTDDSMIQVQMNMREWRQIAALSREVSVALVRLALKVHEFIADESYSLAAMNDLENTFDELIKTLEAKS